MAQAPRGSDTRDDEGAQPETEVMLLFLEIPIPPEEAAKVLLEEYGEPWCRELVAKLVATTLPLEQLFENWNGDQNRDDDQDGDTALPFTGVTD